MYLRLKCGYVLSVLLLMVWASVSLHPVPFLLIEFTW